MDSGEQTGRRVLSPRATLVILTLVYVLNYLDRQIVGILSGPIRAEFHLTNTEVGLLNGPAFALTYAVLGIPIAALADRWNRRNVIAASLAVFSVMTILCGAAARFWQLLLARFATGIGEAGTSPAITSILADLYPPERRGEAISFYSAGLNIGLLLGFFGGAWIAELYGWRNAFLAAGLPGLVLTAVLIIFIAEPVRGDADHARERDDAPTFTTVIAWLFRRRSFLWLSLGAAFSSFSGYANIAFVPIFLQESHHMPLHAIGLVLAVFVGGAGALGTWLAGVAADHYGARDLRWNMYVPTIAALVAPPFLAVFLLASNIVVAIAAGVVPAFMAAVFVGPAFAMGQAVAPVRMRVRAAAVLLFILNILGLALAAPAVGWISEILKPALGPDALRFALLTGMFTGWAGAFCYWRASRFLARDIAAADTFDAQSPPPTAAA